MDVHDPMDASGDARSHESHSPWRLGSAREERRPAAFGPCRRDPPRGRRGRSGCESGRAR